MKTYEINCEIINDLIPSYLDGICSESSKNLIDLHIGECENCKKHLELLKGQELSAEKLDNREIDFMKKVKKRSAARNVFFAVFASIIVFLLVFHFAVRSIPVRLQLLFIPIFLFGAFFLQKDYVKKPGQEIPFHKPSLAVGSAGSSLKFNTVSRISGSAGSSSKPGAVSTISAAISFLLMAYPIILMFLAISWVKADAIPFRILPEQLGPFVNGQILAAGILESILYLGTILLCQMKSRLILSTQAISITGCTIGFYFSYCLHELTSVEHFIRNAIGTVAIFLAEGLVCGLVLMAMYRRKAG